MNFSLPENIQKSVYNAIFFRTQQDFSTKNIKQKNSLVTVT